MSCITSIIESATTRTTAFQPNRRQLEDLGTWKSMGSDQATNTVFRWLLSDEKDRIELATAMIVGSGAPAVPLLVSEAVRRRRSDSQRIRLLEVIERIGVPLSADEFFDLYELLQRSTRPVQLRIVQLFSAHRSAGDADMFARSQPPGIGPDMSEF
jgi:hypothetical protein